MKVWLRVRVGEVGMISWYIGCGIVALLLLIYLLVALLKPEVLQ